MKEYVESGSKVLAVVDMSHPDKSELAKIVRKACIEVGFFYVTNHGIDQELIDEVLRQSKRFFDLPLDDKMSVMHDEKYRGYSPMGQAMLDTENSTKGDSNEGYYVGWDLPQDHTMAKLPNHGPNKWPREELIPGWKEVVQKYYFEGLKLGHQIASLIALALDMEADFFEDFFTTPMVVLRLLHYTAAVSKPEEGTFGCGEHTDWGLLTVLAADENAGLQICRKKNAVPRVWEAVAPMEGALIVNLGDMLERWTNGLFQSTLHRVLTTGAERYSVPFFFQPNYDTMVECLPTCCSPGNLSKYPPITSGEHLVSKYKGTHTAFENLAKQATVKV